MYKLADPQSVVDDLPGVSILKPLMGVDPLLETNLESHFTLSYPKVWTHCYCNIMLTMLSKYVFSSVCLSVCHKYWYCSRQHIILEFVLRALAASIILRIIWHSWILMRSPYCGLLN